MIPFQPYSERLAHGTLLLFHTEAVARRYTAVRHGIMFDAMAIVGVALLCSAAGWMLQEPGLVATGAVVATFGTVVWGTRLVRLRHRHRRTPTMVFVAEEGVSAIMSDGQSISLPWNGISAHEAGFVPSFVAATFVRDRHAACRGLLLKGASQARLYITRDLVGFEDLLCVLADLAVPVFSVSHRIHGMRSGRQGEVLHD